MAGFHLADGVDAMRAKPGDEVGGGFDGPVVGMLEEFAGVQVDEIVAAAVVVDRQFLDGAVAPRISCFGFQLFSTDGCVNFLGVFVGVRRLVANGEQRRRGQSEDVLAPAAAAERLRRGRWGVKTGRISSLRFQKA